MKMISRIVACGLAIAICASSPAFASESSAQKMEAIVADAVIVRPGWFVATVAGTAIFVVTLPFAAMSRSVDKTANSLVVKPAQATFTRPLGDFSTLD